MSRASYRNVYGADFETDHDNERAWMVQWCISNGTDELYGRDWDSYLKTLSDMMKLRPNIILYFHNLKYDLQFQKHIIARMRDEFGFELKITMRAGSPIKIRLEKNDHSLEFRDSMKKIPGNLRSLGKMVGIPK